ncbi:hypothetical protein [Pseudanabaena sp. lw0831]|uniref:hypothetical protein n=1 Tax=Pseudanabaena sp. lw0831 TaxID=1357935 RepID=UPI001914EBC6|nr:hypothetical protein [Pseudanabaena sp. lw0831]
MSVSTMSQHFTSRKGSTAKPNLSICDHPHTQIVMSSLMMLRSQMSTGMSSETLQQMIAKNPDDIIRLLQESNPNN